MAQGQGLMVYYSKRPILIKGLRPPICFPIFRIVVQAVSVRENGQCYDRPVVPVPDAVGILVHPESKIFITVSLHLHVDQEPLFFPVFQVGLDELIRMSAFGFRLGRELFQFFIQKSKAAFKIDLIYLFRKEKVEEILDQVLDDPFPENVLADHG